MNNILKFRICAVCGKTTPLMGYYVQDKMAFCMNCDPDYQEMLKKEKLKNNLSA